MNKTRTQRRWFFSSSVQTLLARNLRRAADRLVESGVGADDGLIVAFAGDVFQSRGLPLWTTRPTTKFFLLADIPEAAIILLPGELKLRRPDLRLYVCRDPESLRRLIVSQYRDRPLEGIVDAFLVLDELVVFAGDLELRRFPIQKIAPLKGLGRAELESFEIDLDGSYLFWESADIHLGLSELLMETDLNYRVEREMERHQKDHIATVLAHMRASRRLRQSDIAGLSERHVRRLEKGESHLTTEAAEKLARSFGLETAAFLEELSKLSARVAQLKVRVPSPQGKRTVA